ncbi:MAG: hypothetical protein CVU38_00780 [Chloroflexi bacterium HGW-Chloroflexi-1]|nr:MAG: hypothetical protein CVU38_00780 [Chloroflexi bacterium HGW-Chloroflexi-1]
MKRPLIVLALALLWILIPAWPPARGQTSTPETRSQPANPFPHTGAHAFASPTGEAVAWLTPGPAPELWLAAGADPPRLILRGESEHFSRPHWSPDGRALAVLAVPTGTQTAALGRQWVVDLNTSAAITQVPPDGTDAAWFDNPSLSLPEPNTQYPIPDTQYPVSSFQPPATIRVAHHPDNSCRDLPAWAVTVLSFEEYVARVLPAEVYTTWPAATLQAQAIAIRTFAWLSIALAAPGATYDITDWAVDQVMCDQRYGSTDAATAATAGQYLAYEGALILAQYSAENGHPTVDGGRPYLQAVLDPVSLGQPRHGHGHGLSQWGAYRWSALHGWNATQILAHYYTGAQVVDPSGVTPNLALLTPWPGAWLTAATARITAHAAFAPPETVTVTFRAPGWTAVDADSTDGWGAVWPFEDALARPVTLTASTGVLTHTLVLAGADRIPPEGNLTLPANTTSLTVPLRIAGTDLGGSELMAAAVGGDWQARAADFQRQAGQGALVPDPDALSGNALVLPAGIASRWRAILPEPLVVNHIYQAYARLRITQPTTRSAASPVASVRAELYDPAGGVLLGFADLWPGDFRQAGVYQEFPIDFWLTPAASGQIGVWLITSGDAEIALDRVRVLAEPQPFQTDLVYTLERRAGPQTVVAKLIDGAGNPSTDLVGTTELLDVTPPGNWRLLAPSGWVTTTTHPLIVARAADDLSGIALESAEARWSADAGVSWSPWQPISATALPDLTAEFTLAWPGAEGGGNNRVQLRAADHLGWRSTSPAWPVRVDLTPPAVYADLSATPSATGWITTPATLTLWAEDATAGVAGIWYAQTGPGQRASAGSPAPVVSGPVSTQAETWQPYAAPVSLFGEGEVLVRYYALDHAGLCSAIGQETWRFDTTPPTTVLTAPARYPPAAPIPVSWTGQDGSDIAAFDVQFSLDLGPWKEWLQATAFTDTHFPPLAFGALRLRARARDLAGNVGLWSEPQQVTVGSAFQFLPLVSSWWECYNQRVEVSLRANLEGVNR